MAATSARLRVAMAGAGWVSAFHLAAWKSLGNVELVAICDPERERAESRAREFGIARVFIDAGEMLDATRPDAIDIAAPVEVHGALCRLAADRGVHILCQKPLAASLREAQSIVTEVGARVRLMVHENWRFRPHYRQLRHWLDEGTLGEPVSCSMRVRSSGLLPDENGRFPQLERQGFFATLPRLLIGELLIHHLDVVRWLMGPLKVKAACAGRSCTAVRGEDHAVIVLQNETRYAVVDGSLVAAGTASRPLDQFELIGTRGAAYFAQDEVRLAGAREESFAIDAEIAYSASYLGAISHFVAALTSGAPFETSAEDNLQTLALVEDAYSLARPAAIA